MIHNSFSFYLPQVIELLKAHKITSAYLFGSVVTERFNENSDIDFLVNIQEGLDPVDAGEQLWELEDDLKALLGRKIDLLTEKSLKNPYFISEVNSTKVPIYGK